MAFVLKYTHDFHQIKDYGNSSEWRIEIFEEGYVGSSSEFSVDAGSITMDNGGGLLQTVQGTKLRFSMINTTEGEFSEFREASFGLYKAILIKDPNGTPLTKFIGYNQSEIYIEEYNQPPYSSVLEFTCGLNHLKHVRFDDAENEISESNKNTNSTATVSASTALISTIDTVDFSVEYVSGSHDLHTVVLQTSPDDIIWTDSVFSIAGVGFAKAFGLSTNFIRLKVTIAEGAASVSNWNISPIFHGQRSIIEVVRLCLNKLPSPIAIREIVNVYEDNNNSTLTDSMLNQVFVDSSVYREIKTEGSEESEAGFLCNTVLEEIFKVFQCRIYQIDGLWHIIRNQEFEGATLYWREFNPNIGTENIITVDNTGSYTANSRVITGPTGVSSELVLVAADSEMSILHPLNRVTITYNQESIDMKAGDLIKNGNFGVLTYTLVVLPLPLRNRYVPSNWTFVGVNYLTYDAVDIIDVGLLGWYTFGLDSTTVLDPTKYGEYVKTNIPTSTVDSMNFSFKVRINYTSSIIPAFSYTTLGQDFMSNTAFVTSVVRIQLGSYYLSGSDGGLIPSPFAWTLTPSVAFFTHHGGLEFDVTTTTEWTHSLDLPLLPENGLRDLNVRFFPPYHNLVNGPTVIVSHTANAIHQTAFSLIYKPIEQAPITDLILYAEIDEDEDVEKIDVIHGDGSNSVTLNSFRLADTNITDVWNRRGETDNLGILYLLLEQLSDLRGDFVKNTSGKLIGEFEIYNSILDADVSGPNILYLIDSYNWSIETNEYTVNLLQIGDSVKIYDTIPQTEIPQLISSVSTGIDGGGRTQEQDPFKVIAQDVTFNSDNTVINDYI